MERRPHDSRPCRPVPLPPARAAAGGKRGRGQVGSVVARRLLGPGGTGRGGAEWRQKDRPDAPLPWVAFRSRRRRAGRRRCRRAGLAASQGASGHRPPGWRGRLPAAHLIRAAPPHHTRAGHRRQYADPVWSENRTRPTCTGQCNNGVNYPYTAFI